MAVIEFACKTWGGTNQARSLFHRAETRLDKAACLVIVAAILETPFCSIRNLYSNHATLAVK